MLLQPKNWGINGSESSQSFYFCRLNFGFFCIHSNIVQHHFMLKALGRGGGGIKTIIIMMGRRTVRHLMTSVGRNPWHNEQRNWSLSSPASVHWTYFALCIIYLFLQLCPDNIRISHFSISVTTFHAFATAVKAATAVITDSPQWVAEVYPLQSCPTK